MSKILDRPSGDPKSTPINEEKYEPKSCPEFKKCELRITLNQFKLLCNTKNFPNCVCFCTKRNLLKNPTEWMISLAVNDAIALVDQEVPV